MLKFLIINLGVTRKRNTHKTPPKQMNLTTDNLILPIVRAFSTVCNCILIDKIKYPYSPNPTFL